ncbi:hypothetical protein HN859_02255, partial [Candidatus Parcubacteria bacterium]|nr:hypothetical protein [Candidatus Parcubacteria bacterium]
KAEKKHTEELEQSVEETIDAPIEDKSLFGKFKKRLTEEKFEELFGILYFDYDKTLKRLIEDTIDASKNSLYRSQYIKYFADNTKPGKRKLIYTNTLHFGRREVRKLPNHMQINGSLYLTTSSVKKLPYRLLVKGDMDILNTEITKLPEDLVVEGTLFLDEKLGDQAEALKQKGQIDAYDYK